MNWFWRRSDPIAPKAVPLVGERKRKSAFVTVAPKKRKAMIPTAFREQIWLRDCGKAYESKCRVTWCQNRMTVWDFQAGHNVPESRGGKTVPDNLIPICSRCNVSMGNRYTIDEWNALSQAPPTHIKKSFWCCF
jgi:5-methylcytosine-specific restriction endonuclease McrA